MRRLVTDPPTRPAEPPVMIHLLGGPSVSVGAERRAVPEGSKRLRGLRRAQAQPAWSARVPPACCGPRPTTGAPPATCAPRCGGCAARASTSWWRTSSSLALRPDVAVDVHVAGAVGGPADSRSGAIPTTTSRALGRLSEALDLLPGWYDDWVSAERERLRQRLLHAVEALGRRLTHGRAARRRDRGRDARHRRRPAAGERPPGARRGAPRGGQLVRGAAQLRGCCAG